jgi:hypothetical protein
LDAAMVRVKDKFSDRQFQIFDLLVNKEWPAADVAQLLCVTVANIYVIRHRISSAVKRETKRLENQLEDAAKGQIDQIRHRESSPHELG